MSLRQKAHLKWSSRKRIKMRERKRKNKRFSIVETKRGFRSRRHPPVLFEKHTRNDQRIQLWRAHRLRIRGAIAVIIVIVIIIIRVAQKRRSANDVACSLARISLKQKKKKTKKKNRLSSRSRRTKRRSERKEIQKVPRFEMRRFPNKKHT